MNNWTELMDFLKKHDCGIEMNTGLYSPYHLILPDNEKFLLGPSFTFEDVKDIITIWQRQQKQVDELIKQQIDAIERVNYLR